MTAFETGPQRKDLAEALKRLRLSSGMTGYQLAEEIGINQSTLSRIERNQQRITVSQVALWCKATNAPQDRLAELLSLAEDILIGPQSWSDTSTTGSTNAQQDTQDLEARTGTLKIYQPAVIPGLLQTPAYARRVFCSGPNGVPADIAERVMGRIERQRILYDESKHFRFVIPEAVLRWPFGVPDDPATMDEHLEQLARVRATMGRPNVNIRVLPLRPLEYWRLSGFVIYDDVEDGEAQVHLEWLTRPYNEFEASQVEMCRQAFDNLVSVSLAGEDAEALLVRVIDDMRSG